jgi:hypothetical protein
MVRRALLVTFTVATLLLVRTAFADTPTRIAFEVDETFQSGFLTQRCGIPVWVHREGSGTTTLFYDNAGALIREIDTFPAGIRWTYYAPSTGKSFTEVIHSPVMILFPDGTDVGALAIVIFNGVVRTSGPGSPRNVGRQVLEAVVTGSDADGVPFIEPVNVTSEAGQFDVLPVAQARCALLTDP